MVDGHGGARFRADVAVRATIGRSPARPCGRRARRVVDATGRVVAPGFIDLHAHLDPLAELPGARSAVTQA